MPKQSLYSQVDAAWDSHQKAPTPETEARLYETLIKMANAEAGRRFGRPNDDAAGVALTKLTEALKSNAYAKIGGAKFSTWAQRVVNNAVMDEFRDELQRRKIEVYDDGWRRGSKILVDPGMKIESQERQHALEASKSALPPRQRQVVEGLLLGKSGRELAGELGISQQAVTKLWKKALRKVANGR